MSASTEKALRCVFIMPAQPGHWAALLVPPFRHEIKILIGGIEHVETARIARVGPIDGAVRVLEEDAQSRRFLHGESSGSKIVVVVGLFQVVGCERDAKIIVEVV